MKMISSLIGLTAFFIVGLFQMSLAYGSEGHGIPGGVEFRVDKAQVRLRLEPTTFSKDRMPKIIAALTDHMSGNPVLDAELYIQLEKKGEQASHGGHEAPAQSAGSDEESGLDFGETAMTPVSLDVSTFSRLLPREVAGEFGADYHIHEKGVYMFTLAVKSLDGNKFPEPLIYGGKLVYHEASRTATYRMIFVIGLILLAGLIGIWVVFIRRTAGAAAGHKMNLLDVPWIGRFVKSGWFQPSFQIPVFIVFMIIIVAGLFDVQQGDRNMATLLMWTIWWAAIIFTFVFVGRVWCMMCPVGALQDWMGRLVKAVRQFPKGFRNIYLSSFVFFGLTWWDSYSGIVNKPALTAYLLLGFFGVAGAMALVFRGRTFCRYVCPIGGLIGIYSMFSPVELRNRCNETCREHRVKECIIGTEKSSPCPMFVTPATLDRNNYCNFCGECVKSCSQSNIAIRFRGFAKDIWQSAKGHMDEAYLVLLILGISIIVTGEMVEPWHKWMDVVGKLFPYGAFGLSAHGVTEKVTFLIVITVGSLVIPAALLLLTALVVRKTTGPHSPLGLMDTVVQFAYMFIPVGLSMHLAHNISHLFKEGPGIIPAVQRTLNEYAGLAVRPDWEITPIMGNEAIFWLQMVIIVALNIFSLYAGYRLAVRHYGDKAVRAFIPMACLAVLFMTVNAFILGQPMAMRHTH